jgi:hypothetical protein
MEEIAVQTARFIGHLILELLWYYTAKAILPLVSLGLLQIQPLSTRNQAAWWWQRPFKRLSAGRVEVSVPMASIIGFLIWGILIVRSALHYGAG